MGGADARTLLSKVFCRGHAEPPVVLSPDVVLCAAVLGRWSAHVDGKAKGIHLIARAEGCKDGEHAGCWRTRTVAKVLVVLPIVRALRNLLRQGEGRSLHLPDHLRVDHARSSATEPAGEADVVALAHPRLQAVQELRVGSQVRRSALHRVNPRLHGTQSPCGTPADILRVLGCHGCIVYAYDSIVPVDTRSKLTRSELAPAADHGAAPKSFWRWRGRGVPHELFRHLHHITISGPTNLTRSGVAPGPQPPVAQPSGWMVQQERWRESICHEEGRPAKRPAHVAHFA